MRVGVIGPTNLQQLCALLEMPADILLEKAAQVGRALAESPLVDELWVNPDSGMIGAVAQAYKQYGGKKLVMLLPRRPIPWPIEHAEPYAALADEVRRPANWFFANYEVVSMPDVCICVGISLGTLGELSDTRFDQQFRRGNLKRLIFIRELLREGILQPEVSLPIAELIQYIETVEELSGVIEGLGFKEPLPSR